MGLLWLLPLMVLSRCLSCNHPPSCGDRSPKRRSEPSDKNNAGIPSHQDPILNKTKVFALMWRPNLTGGPSQISTSSWNGKELAGRPSQNSLTVLSQFHGQDLAEKEHEVLGLVLEPPIFPLASG
ncbi:hypothetical protein FH972_015193 [Carpinus fangiana]|uniref:Uncharacterized protein n=1 Tax=Carpinus fangiana TaxID=176857 RepID=A0A5N6RFG2_9ROSI|nr:hypothetical protein FH972_015193 [Carpinus fangiana]